MSPQAYILEQLELLKTPETIEQKESLIETCYARVTSKKFRKYALAAGGDQLIKAAIRTRIEKNESITFGFPFGAYKLWRLHEAPEVDWAELFTLLYFARWLAPLCALHKPGIHFVFCGQELLAEKLNNLSPEETNRYKESFNTLLRFLSACLPPNMHIELMPLRSIYEKETFNTRLEEEAQNNFPNLESLTIPEREAKTILMNVRVTPEQERDALWIKKIYALHESFFMPGFFSNAEKFTRKEDVICVFPTPIGGNCVATGTTKSSIAKFWVGVGALKKSTDSFTPVVLSPQQLEAATAHDKPMSSLELPGKNFDSIRII